MLKKKTVSDKDTRIKYALLALLCAVILPTSHNPRILPQHAEKIKYMDEFILPQHVSDKDTRIKYALISICSFLFFKIFYSCKCFKFQYPIVRLKKSMRVTDRQYMWRRHGKPSSFSPELSIFIFGFWHTNISNNALHNKLLRMYLAFIHKDCTLCFVWTAKDVCFPFCLDFNLLMLATYFCSLPCYEFS